MSWHNRNRFSVQITNKYRYTTNKTYKITLNNTEEHVLEKKVQLNAWQEMEIQRKDDINKKLGNEIEKKDIIIKELEPECALLRKKWEINTESSVRLKEEICLEIQMKDWEFMKVRKIEQKIDKNVRKTFGRKEAS